MDFSALRTILSGVGTQPVFMRTSPEVLDFTDKSSLSEIIFATSTQEIKILLADETLPLVMEMLKLSFFQKGLKVVCWDWKSLASFIAFKTKKLFHVDASIIDLKILESYSGNKIKHSPKTFVDAFNRLKAVMGSWKQIENVYKNLHIPLMTSVLPHLETTGIINKNLNSKVFAHYEIDGQENGRLRCSGLFQNSFVPHAMGPEVRESLFPRTDEEMFMLFDYKGMEVFMLAWLSDDPVLKELCKEPDIYSALYSKITGKIVEGKEDRELAKKFFLPVVYGQSASGLSNRCGVAIEVAESIVGRISEEFPVSMNFVASYQKQLLDFGYAKDFFGKKRVFEKGKEFAVRNFSVQSPSAVVCSEKLCHLYYALKDITDIAYTVHDGYVVYATKENWKKVFKIGNDVLGGESDFCPGLRLRVACRAGRNLNNLKSLVRKGE